MIKDKQFAYWLAGFVQVTGGRIPNEDEWDKVKRELAHITGHIPDPLTTVTTTNDSKPWRDPYIG